MNVPSLKEIMLAQQMYPERAHLVKFQTYIEPFGKGSSHQKVHLITRDRERIAFQLSRT